MLEGVGLTQEDERKIVLLGRTCSGKTCLVVRYTKGTFDFTPRATIGSAFTVAVERTASAKLVKLLIWDTSGEERYEHIVPLYYRNARAAIICFDLTDDESFRKVDFWFQRVKAESENCKIYLCGTKLDMLADGHKRALDETHVREYAARIDAPYFETSSCTGENVHELFRKIAADLAVPNAPTPSGVTLGKKDDKKPCPC